MIISHKYKFIFIKTAKTAGTSIEVFFSPICGENDIFTPFSIPESAHTPRNYKGYFNPLSDLKYKIKKIYDEKNILAAWSIKELFVNFITRKKYYHHIPAWQIKNRISEIIWKSYYKFCFERNPYDKVISGWYWYNHVTKKNISFDNYLKVFKFYKHVRDHGVGMWPYNYLCYTDPKNGDLLVDDIYYYEQLIDSLKIIMEKLHINTGVNSFPIAKTGIRNYHNFREQISEDQSQIILNLFEEEFILHGYKQIHQS